MDLHAQLDRLRTYELPAVKNGGKGTSVLVVEDDADLRHAMAVVFHMYGFDVRTAQDGVDAAKMAMERLFDVIVSDLRLPGLTGFGIAQSLRSRQTQTQVILITAYPEWRVIEEARQMGIQYVLSKPLDLLKLAELVEQVAGGRVATDPPAPEALRAG